MRVLFRCDASSRIGTGHLMRCLNLAGALQGERGASCCFFMRRLEPDLSALPAERGHLVRIAELAINDELAPLENDDLDQTLRVATELTIDWVVMDSYLADGLYLKSLSRGPWRIGVCDDLADRDLRAAHLVVNPTPGSGEWDYRTSPDVRLLTGPEFALLDPAYSLARARVADQRNPSWRPERVLICLGGADAMRMTSSVIETVLAQGDETEVRAVQGPAVQQDLAGRWSIHPRVTILDHQTPLQMTEQMLWADLAIATPSTIAWELACLGLPALLLVTVANQKRVAEELERRALASICHDLHALEQQLVLEMNASPLRRVERQRRWQALCDGEGASRVASQMAGL